MVLVLRGRCLLLPDDVTVDQVAQLAERSGGRKILEQRGEPEFGLVHEVTWELRPGLNIHYGRERPSGAAYVMASAADRQEEEELTGLLREYFNTVDDEEVLAAVDRAATPEQLKVALVRAGIAAPLDADQEYAARIRAALQASDAERREAGIWAATYASWEELDPHLAEIAANDPLPLLRRQAQGLLDYWQREAPPR